MTVVVALASQLPIGYWGILTSIRSRQGQKLDGCLTSIEFFVVPAAAPSQSTQWPSGTYHDPHLPLPVSHPPANLRQEALHIDSSTMPTTPVLLIHAFPFDSRMWRPQTEAIGTTRMVIAPDLSGFGRNTTRPYPTTIDHHARQMIALLDQAGIPRAMVVGLSMGGHIALAMQRIGPDRIAALMLCDTKADPDTLEAKAGRSARIQRVRSEGIDFLPDEMIPALVSPNASTSTKLELRHMILDQDPHGVESALIALRDRPDASSVLPSIRVPCALVCGEHDKLSTPSAMQAMARQIPGAMYATISNAGHMSNMEAPIAFNRILLEMITTTP